MSRTDKTKEKINPIVSVYEWVEVICVALFAVVVLFTFVCRLVTVSGQSMENTFYNGDRLIISDLFYEPKAGDVVVVQNINDKNFRGPIIKRVIATENDVVDVDSDNWKITVTHPDGRVSVFENEPYVKRIKDSGMGYGYIRYPYTVEKGHVFVMGDNRTNSYDSRSCGSIDERMILGKVYLRVAPNPEINFSK